METQSKNGLLRSWKEIATVLGVDERTCYRWEKRFRMPVHRAEEGGLKSHVFAYKDELDLWFKETFTSSGGAGAAARTKHRVPIWVIVSVALFICTVGVVGFFMIKGKGASGQPMDFALRGSTLTVLDEYGKALWRKTYATETLQPESFYLKYSQVPIRNGTGPLYALVIRDIDGDGNNEVLFAIKCLTDQTGEGVLYCYDSKGVELWHFSAGREMVFGGKSFSPDYRIRGFTTHDINKDGLREVVIFSQHAPHFPSQLAILDCHGRQIGEFWNSGYLQGLAFHDINGDGKEELLVTGVNNQYGGFLAVFDPLLIQGASPQTGEFRAEGVPEGSELAYIIFPRSDVSVALEEMAEGFELVTMTKNDRIRLTSGHSLYFEFDFGLRCLSLYWGHAYIRAHGELKAEGKVHSVLDDAYGNMMMKGIRYWNGSAWVPGQTMILKNAGLHH